MAGKHESFYACGEVEGKYNDVCGLASRRMARSVACEFLKIKNGRLGNIIDLGTC